MKSIFRNKCLCCNSTNLDEIINLGNHSFADRFIPKSKVFFKDPVYPLILDLCSKCNFIQSRAITNPKKRYVDFNYSYTSDNSNYSRNHWNKFASDLDKQFNFKNKKIIEIGSNDGFLSNILKKKGANILAVDASNLMVKICRKKKIKSIQSIFTNSESKKIKKIYGVADFIIANNVFNHSNNPNDFLKGVKNLLKDDGKFIFEQPNFTKGVISLKFDQIYHEHISYFTAKNIKSILNYNNFKIMDISNNDYHGGSLRTVAIIKRSKEKVPKENKINLRKYVSYEVKNKIYKIKNYRDMMIEINRAGF